MSLGPGMVLAHPARVSFGLKYGFYRNLHSQNRFYYIFRLLSVILTFPLTIILTILERLKDFEPVGVFISVQEIRGNLKFDKYVIKHFAFHSQSHQQFFVIWSTW